MLLSRFWYVFVGLAVGALTFMLFLAQSMYNRTSARALGEALAADNQVVAWYLKNDARERSAQLIKFAVNGELAKGLSESSKSDLSVPEKSRAQVKAALTSVATKIAKDESFDAVFAVDQLGRVVAHLGYEQADGVEDFELGGYPVVADALHGYVRDDTLLLDRVYRIVARPVEFDLGQLPAGAIVGARIVDERFARELSERTGAALAFFVGDRRVAAGAPADFEKTQLDRIVSELPQISEDASFKEKGVTAVRNIGSTLAYMYGRIPGETWQLDVGYSVARNTSGIPAIWSFFNLADDKDKKSANMVLVIGLAALAMSVGLLFSVLEYTRPLNKFQADAQLLAKGQVETFQPSRYRGAFRQLAADLNDGIERAAAKGGGTRRAADLQQVIGDLPDQPQMSAFSFPGQDLEPSSGGIPISALNIPASSAGLPSSGAMSSAAGPPPAPSAGRAPPRPPGAELGGPPRPPAATSNGEEVDPEWHGIYTEFVRIKQSCGEPTQGLTFEKFQLTLRKNRDAIVQRHGVNKVKFSVYVKDGRAALKASPLREA